jgi:hypothetical protein
MPSLLRRVAAIRAARMLRSRSPPANDYLRTSSHPHRPASRISNLYPSARNRARSGSHVYHSRNRPSSTGRSSNPPPLNWSLPDHLVLKTQVVVDGGWAPKTRENHDGAVRRFLQFCDSAAVPSHSRLPASEPVVSAWLASMHGCKSGATARNELAGLRSWHVRSNAPFPPSLRFPLILESIERSRPERSHLPPRSPVSIDMLRLLHSRTAIPSSFDLAVRACASVAFWGQFRLGELLPTSQRAFKPKMLPTRAAWGSRTNPTIHLPWTKTTRSAGAVVRLPPQLSRTCPVDTLSTFLLKTPAPPTSPLFTYASRDGALVTLTKRAFLDRVNAIWTAHRYPRITGHAFRIGGTTELLRCGVPPDMVKRAGRWSSDSFLRYWRKEEEILPQHLDQIAVSRRHTAPVG